MRNIIIDADNVVVAESLDPIEGSISVTQTVRDSITLGASGYVNGQVVAITAWPNRDIAIWKVVRYQRNKLLASCDYTQLADSSVSLLDKPAWTTYRQALRDITTQSDPANIAWPVAPV